MIGERRVFVSMNEGVEKIANRLRERVATFTREYSRQNARKANNHRYFLRVHNKTPRPHLGSEPYEISAILQYF
jgi:hypothetical protein